MADFIGGGLGTGSVSIYPGDDGFDGYQSWFYGPDGRDPNYLSLIFEAKFTGSQPFSSFGRFDEARDHIELLASERDRFYRDHPGLSIVGTPIYVVASQNRRGIDWNATEGQVRPEWELGSTSSQGRDYHDELVDLANSLGVAIIHAKVARGDLPLLDGQWTRNLEFQFMNEIQWADHTSNPFLSWLTELATTVDPSETGRTYTYPANLDLRCEAAQEKVDNKHRAPPGGIRL